MRIFTSGVILVLCGCTATMGRDPSPATPVPNSEPRTIRSNDPGWIPIATEPPTAAEPADQPKPKSDASCKDRTHVIVINGLDPLFLGRLNDFCKKVEGAGYKNVSLLPLRGGSTAERKIFTIRQEDPEAKIVLAGYSWGANEVRSVCQALKEKNIKVDLLVYMGGDMVGNRAYSRPENAGRIVNINAHGLLVLGGDLIWNGTEIDNAKNYRLDVRHLGLPRQNQTLDIFLREIKAMCGE